jgi:hypothetical protein
MKNNYYKFYDHSTIFCDSGVATPQQIKQSLEKAIEQAEKILGYKTNCKFRINLITKEGAYYGIGYIYITCPKIYWMLLGKNPDGTDRYEEILDPDWKPPKRDNNRNQIISSWSDMVEEKEKFIHPKIKKTLKPLINIPKYKYNDGQLEHLKELQEKTKIPELGFFEISRAYAVEPPENTLKYRLCARNIQNWIPIEAFQQIFSFYSHSESYPKINFIDSKKGGRIVFISFNPKSDDALFALLMTKKLSIINTNNPEQKKVLIFMHAFDKHKKR